ncbi:DUF1648 domain-containing protein [Streptomyces sp. BR123]|uniref:DUF1648 domain-containing protein n=1 Tax=Streptomyces sp. BR123 TaxID=2749828 RepID=UPI001C4F1268|nr:DUF1648 domain-containing protein [Streptomyces sp. BR123]
MTDRTGRPSDADRGGGPRIGWGAGVWGAAVTAVLALLPPAVSSRLPDRLATHWDGTAPDGSMPLWAAALAPAAVWVLLLLGLLLAARRRGAPGRHWTAATLAVSGVFLAGAQVSIVRANLDRADWRDAASTGTGMLVVAAAAVGAGALGWLAGRHGEPPSAVRETAAGPLLEIPEGERFVWLSRTTNRWLRLTGAVAALIAAVAVLVAAAGLAAAPPWALIAPFAVVALAASGCSSVQARVTEKGLEVAFGPLGRPVRRWRAEDIVSARAETRTPAQVGGWGYRIGGQGTTVMLRSGECLVVRPRTGSDFAVSVDDAERGAALLNTLSARRSA